MLCADEILELNHSKDSPRGRKRPTEEQEEKFVEYPEFTGYSSENINNTSIIDEDDTIPEDMPLSIITSTLGRLSL